MNCRLLETTWKIVEETIYKTYTNLTNLTDAFNQSALASSSIVILANVSILIFFVLLTLLMPGIFLAKNL